MKKHDGWALGLVAGLALAFVSGCGGGGGGGRSGSSSGGGAPIVNPTPPTTPPPPSTGYPNNPAWTGPWAKIVVDKGRQVFEICDTTCVRGTPFSLAINTQTLTVESGNWEGFLYEAKQLSRLTQDNSGTLPILQVHLLGTDDRFLDQLAEKLTTLSPKPYLFVRFYLQDPPSTAGFERMRLEGMDGTRRDDANGAGSPWTLNDAWLARQEQEIERVMMRLNDSYPGKVIGVHLSYENAGEFFFRPHGFSGNTQLDWGDERLCGERNGTKVCGLYPWSNDDGSQAGPMGRDHFYLYDYANDTETAFCNWNVLPSVLRNGCRAASVAERNNSVRDGGEQDGRARGVLLDPADQGSLRAAYYNWFVSLRNVAAIERLLDKVKRVSGGKALTSAYYGYLHSLDAALPTSGHTAMTQLLEKKAIDLVSGPHSYGATRSLGEPFISQGPDDAPGIRGKLWVDEDDTRTHLACGTECDTSAPLFAQTALTLEDSIRVMRRNLLSAGIRGKSVYALDLPGAGWFGRVDKPDDTAQLWEGMRVALNAVKTLDLTGSQAYKPEVALFVDDLSANHVAALSPAGNDTYSFAVDQLSGPVLDLAKLGTPVKRYLVSDLLDQRLDVSRIKMAVFPNAYNLPTATRQAISSRLRNNGRTLVFLYAAGYLQGEAGASVARMKELTGMEVALGVGQAPLQQQFTVGEQTVAGGPAYGLTPWFKVTDPSAEVMGRYMSDGSISMAKKRFGTGKNAYTVVHAAAPAVPLTVWRALSEGAGVHHFTVAGDSVEANGNMVMLHAGSDGDRRVAFPGTMSAIDEVGLANGDRQACTSCSTLDGVAFKRGDTRVWRWRGP